MDKYLSFVVYGADSKYREGALANAQAIAEVYPGWKGIFYVDEESCRDLVRPIEEAGSQVLLINKERFTNMVFARFLPIWELSKGIILFRDIDSLISIPERKAVEDWLQTGLPFHWMRDHPRHTGTVMWGMWGMRLGDYFRDYFEHSIEGSRNESYGADQVFLEQWLYPTMLKRGVVYSDFLLLPGETRRAWPAPRPEDKFVGSVSCNNKDVIETLSIERLKGEPDTGERPHFFQRRDRTTFRLNLAWNIRNTVQRLSKRSMTQ